MRRVIPEEALQSSVYAGLLFQGVRQSRCQSEMVRKHERCLAEASRAKEIAVTQLTFAGHPIHFPRISCDHHCYDTAIGFAAGVVFVLVLIACSLWYWRR